MKQGCKAYVRGDQYHCHKCEMQWDINDPEPPECKPVKVIVVGTPGSRGYFRDKYMAEIRDKLK